MASDDDLKYYDDREIHKAIDTLFIIPEKLDVVSEYKSVEKYVELGEKLKKAVAKQIGDPLIEDSMDSEIKIKEDIDNMNEISKIIQEGADCNYLFKGGVFSEIVSIVTEKYKDLLLILVQNGLDLNTKIVSTHEDIDMLLHIYLDKLNLTVGTGPDGYYRSEEHTV